MKPQVLLAVLAWLTVSATAAGPEPIELKPAEISPIIPAVLVGAESVAEPQTAVVQNRYLNIGYVNIGDRLLFRQYAFRAPVMNQIQTQDITFQGFPGNRVTAVYANEMGYTQYATAYLVAGGLNTNTARVRLTSARGYGYYYNVEFWGRDY